MLMAATFASCNKVTKNKLEGKWEVNHYIQMTANEVNGLFAVTTTNHNGNSYSLTEPGLPKIDALVKEHIYTFHKNGTWTSHLVTTARSFDPDDYFEIKKTVETTTTGSWSLVKNKPNESKGKDNLILMTFIKEDISTSTISLDPDFPMSSTTSSSETFDESKEKLYMETISSTNKELKLKDYNRQDDVITSTGSENRIRLLEVTLNPVKK